MVGITISKTELERLRTEARLLAEDTAAQSICISDYELHERSKTRSKSWHATRGDRQQHLLERERRLQLQEENQRRIDQEEEERKARKHADLILDANQKMQKNSDHIRRFSAAMMLSDVLAERDQQIRVKQELDQIRRIRDIKYDELIKHNVHRMEQRERESREIEAQKRLAVKQMQLEQLKELESKWKQDRKLKKHEGLMIREMDAIMLKEEEERARIRRNNEIEAHRETMLAQQYLKEVKRSELEREKLEDAAIQRLAKQKEEIDELRKRRLEEIHNQKQIVREKLIEAQAARNAEMQAKEKDVSQRHAENLATNQTQIEAKRAERERLWKEDLDKCRKIQVKEKEKRNKAEVEEQKLAAKLTELALEQIDVQQAEDESRRRNAQKLLQSELLEQIEQHRMEKAHLQASIHECKSRGATESRNYKEEIREYMNRYLKEYTAEGRNVIPLQKMISQLEHEA